MRVPMYERVLGAPERMALLAAFDAREVASHGAFVDEFERRCAALTDRAHAVSCTNGTAAIQLALLALGIGPGDEVICPTFTFSGTAAAITHVGATPILVDADAATWCISVDAAVRAITPRTKAIITVDVYGVPCDYVALQNLCRERGIFLIEDAAEAQGARAHGAPCGSFGDIATMSFYENKIVAAGEGGVCVTNDSALAQRLRMYKSHGARDSGSGIFDVPGFNYRMSNLHAALACAQFAQLEQFAQRRRATDAQYRAVLADLPAFTFQHIPADTAPSFWMTGVRYEGDVAALVAALAADDIETRPFFLPIHAQPYARTWPARAFLVADDLHSHGICLPNGNTTTPEQVAYVCERVRAHVASTRRA